MFVPLPTVCVLHFVSVLGQGEYSPGACSDGAAYTPEQRVAWAVPRERSDDFVRACSGFACILVVVVAGLVWFQARQIAQLQADLAEVREKVGAQRDVAPVQKQVAEPQDNDVDKPLVDRPAPRQNDVRLSELGAESPITGVRMTRAMQLKMQKI